MNDDRIEISVSKNKSIKLILYGILFTAMGLFLLVISDKQQELPPLIIDIAGYAILLLSIPSLSYVLYRLTDNSPGIILDAAGINHNINATSIGFIPWREIKEYQIKTIYSTPSLGIVLKDPDSFYQSLNPISRFFNRLNSSLFKASYLITTNALDIEFDEFATLVRTYHQKYSI